MRLARSVAGTTGIVFPSADGLRFAHLSASVQWLAHQDASSAAELERLFPLPISHWMTAIEHWDSAQPLLSRLEAALSNAGFEALSANGPSSAAIGDVQLGPPLISPERRIFAAGANYADHAARAFTALTGNARSEASVAEERSVHGLPPWGFIVLQACVIGDGGHVVAPRSAQNLDYEAEIAVVLAQGGRNLTPSEVKFCGAAPWNDFSIRDPHLGVGAAIDRGMLVWALQKNFQTGNAFGPWLTLDTELPFDDLDFELSVNGERRQASSTANMLYPYAEIAAHLSQYIELYAGDIITSGTPAGTAIEDGRNGRFLRPGDVVRVETTELGSLENLIGQPAEALTPSQ